MKVRRLISSPLLIAIGFGLTVFADQAGTVRANPAEGEVIANWKLASFVDNGVEDEVSGAKLFISQGLREDGQKRPVPAVEEAAGVVGLRFGEGQVLLGKTVGIPGLEAGFFAGNQPFSAKVVFVVLGPPVGNYGVLLDIGHYMRTGVNLLLEKETMRILMRINDGEKAHRALGPTSLEEGKVYTADILFDGSHTTLLLDGEFECMSDIVPLPFDQTFSIGSGNGDRYWFNGVISEISISRPKR